MTFLRQFLIRTTSLDAVSHALSHSVIFNVYEFDFSSTILISSSFALIHITTPFMCPNFKIFQNSMWQWIARIFLYRLVNPEKETTKNLRKKFEKLRVLIINWAENFNSSRGQWYILKFSDLKCVVHGNGVVQKF
jgi:hypothetical protein